jgi:hypothetical protein
MLSWIRKRPRLSMVLIVYRMADQAEKTLYSLSPRYQRDVSEDDYEVIVVENTSDEMLGEERATRHAGNVRYFSREETERTPVHAINFGADQVRGSHLTIMIDGARMLSPGIVRHKLDIFSLAPQAAVTVPSYHLGEKPQQVAVNEGYDSETEAALLKKIGWPEDGYRLFEIAAFAGAYRRGFFVCCTESNVLSMSTEKWRRIGGMNGRYNDFGGGTTNLDLYKRTLEAPDTPFYMLFGEGSFHQHHGGFTTGVPKSERDEVVPQILAQDREIRGENRAAPSAQPIFYGYVHPPAYRFIRQSLDAVSPTTRTAPRDQNPAARRQASKP